MSLIVFGLGMVLVVEGLALALAPSRIEDVLELLRRIPVEARRMIGLIAVTLSVAAIALARSLGL